jgi:hypothetical protein
LYVFVFVPFFLFNLSGTVSPKVSEFWFAVSPWGEGRSTIKLNRDLIRHRIIDQEDNETFEIDMLTQFIYFLLSVLCLIMLKKVYLITETVFVIDHNVFSIVNIKK